VEKREISKKRDGKREKKIKKEQVDRVREQATKIHR
jgi:hypothetical protein